MFDMMMMIYDMMELLPNKNIPTILTPPIDYENKVFSKAIIKISHCQNFGFKSFIHRILFKKKKDFQCLKYRAQK